MALVLGLPKCFAAKGVEGPNRNQYYLCATMVQQAPAKDDDDDDDYDGTNKFFGEVSLEDGGLTRPHVKFYVEPSSKHPGCVHVRCYNNRYWVPEAVDDGYGYVYYIMSTADAPEEDVSKTSSTVFRVKLKDGIEHTSMDPLDSVSFFHLGIQQYAYYSSSQDREGEPKEKRPKVTFFFFREEVTRHFSLIDLSRHVVLPRYVCFKNTNGNYLRLRDDDDSLEFSAPGPEDPRAIFTVTSNNDGTIHIKSTYRGRYWKLQNTESGHRWIKGSQTSFNMNDYSMVFKAAKIGNHFTLQSLGDSHRLCRSLGSNNNSTRFGTVVAGSVSEEAKQMIPDEAKLVLEEPVLSREIYNVSYRADDRRIYGGTDLNMVSASAINSSPKESSKVKLSLKVTQTETRSWDTSVSHKAGVSTTIEVGIPKIGAGFTIEFDYEFSKSFSWGTVESKQKEQNVEYEVTVPPMKKVTVTAVARQAKCDVPFSYTQKDVLYNGEVEITYHEDGMFTGMNSFDIQYVTKEEDFKPEEPKKPSGKTPGPAHNK